MLEINNVRHMVLKRTLLEFICFPDIRKPYMSNGYKLLYSNGLGQIARMIYIRSLHYGHMVRQQL